MKGILIVEDNPVVVKIYRHLLQTAGFDVRVAETGAKGLALARQVKPDLVLLDLMLPDVNGVDVLRQLRADPNLTAVPVVVCSTAYLADMVQAAWEAGATQVLAKAQANPRQIVEVVREILKSEPP